ncbi:D-glycerate dehydrogenase [Halobacillus sp. A5]|uniref:2-hydroxyacid dehydrogenase n=1 Tax=Halobacillus sp. A5 TaxID=2880263 RepID=UPI0020A66185|nr:D-glycerate dehydrogenase [Halobacillus sp. A5]MCP3028268.1 D-glycerate dehydrogenase [Halobacillus sp. A5]
MEKPYIFITRKLPENLIEEFREQFDIKMWESEDQPVPRKVLEDEAVKAQGLLTMLTDQVDEELINSAEDLRIVANMAVGYDNIDVEAAKKYNVTVTNTPEVLTDTTADLTFTLLLTAARRIVEAVDYVKGGEWGPWSPFLLAGSDVHHKKLGIIGMGRIGEAVAKRALGFDMDVVYYNRSRKEEVEKKLNIRYEEWSELIASSDYVICLVPLTDQTKHLFNNQAFKEMKDSAIFVNASRGPVVNEQHLLEALRAGEIRGAGLDVFEEEPISSAHPLLAMDNVVCLPHIGSASTETREAMIELSLKNLEGHLLGNGALTPVYS